MVGASVRCPDRVPFRSVAIEANAGAMAGTARVSGQTYAVTLAHGAASDVGRVRSLNEDALCVASPVFAVADGMGGHEGGDVAAAIAAHALDALKGGGATNAGVLRAALDTSNGAIFERSGFGNRTMGTTATGLAFTDEPSPAVTVFNVGDSRTYRFAAGVLAQVTVDHSHVQELFDAGRITKAEMETHVGRNVITRALGIEPTVVPDVHVLPITVGQRWMICSDGLSGELAANEIAEELARGEAQAAAEALVAAAVAHGGRDNISVVVVDILTIEQYDDPNRTDPRPGRARIAEADTVPRGGTR